VNGVDGLRARLRLDVPRDTFMSRLSELRAERRIAQAALKSYVKAGAVRVIAATTKRIARIEAEIAEIEAQRTRQPRLPGVSS
jgi:hypothetical protein